MATAAVARPGSRDVAAPATLRVRRSRVPRTFYLFLVPTSDRWAGGDRRVTCFIRSLDGSPLDHSYRASS